ncbi:hypothetical protein E2562_016577 [Oryza meyeriana var. granulata]|uniref:Uncharacterized protein n=1 Tax=Oryza meyeriana var. granulata TaxID=110450 RepID=A0A6G1C787_9ORYZ|nr:hypothetical protein E2562_016577 [Oryza meyeriana var. granulata]
MQQLVAKSFALQLNRTPRLDDDLRRFIDGGMVLDELPSSSRLESMTLSLNNATLRLPAAVAFDSLMIELELASHHDVGCRLTHLTLEGIRLAAGSARNLRRLLSSPCCPRLRKLHLTSLAGLTELQLDASELSELTLQGRHALTMSATARMEELVLLLHVLEGRQLARRRRPIAHAESQIQNSCLVYRPRINPFGDQMPTSVSRRESKSYPKKVY